MGSSDGEGKGGGRKRSRSAEGGDDERKGKGKERRDDDSGSESESDGSASGSGSDSPSSSSSSSSSGSRSDSSSGGGGQDRKRHKRERNLEEAMERAKHRAEVTKRSKMWRTVGSSEDDDSEGGAGGSGSEAGEGQGGGEKGGGGGKDRRERKRKKEKKAKKEKKKEKKKKKGKKHKKERKRKKESKKHHKKKDKKRKRSSKGKKGDLPPSMMGAVDLNKFGSRGILREGDFHRKKRDFEVWLQEIVGLPEIPRNRFEALRHFRQYCEDYNTATFPHEKYYDVEKFEMDEYQKQQQKAAFAQMRAEGVFNDEEERRRERMKSQAQQEKDDFAWAVKMMNKEKIEALKEEDLLRAKMKQAYKSGDLATVESIQYKLMTEEERERAKRKTAFTG